MLNKFHRLFLSATGRLSRSTFCWSSAAVALAFFVLFVFLETMVSRGATWILYPPVFWAMFALMTKRLHDRGQSALWILISVIPVLGPLWLIVTLAFRRGSKGENQYGSDPREYGADYLSVDISKAGALK